MTNENLKVWKLLAAGTALIYLYKVVKSQGGTLAGSGINIKPDRIMDLASEFVPQEVRVIAHRAGSKALNRLMEK